jgi:hypothetical protein
MAGSKARKEEKRNAERSGLISIKLGGEGGEKKGGFKKSGFKTAFVAVGEGERKVEEQKVDLKDNFGSRKVVVDGGLDMESDTEDEGYEVYDPRFPTD